LFDWRWFIWKIIWFSVKIHLFLIFDAPSCVMWMNCLNPKNLYNITRVSENVLWIWIFEQLPYFLWNFFPRSLINHNKFAWNRNEGRQCFTCRGFFFGRICRDGMWRIRGVQTWFQILINIFGILTVFLSYWQKVIDFFGGLDAPVKDKRSFQSRAFSLNHNRNCSIFKVTHPDI
jgi:hypothetical protein